MMFFRGKYGVGVKGVGGEVTQGVGWTVGGGEPVGEEVRDHWTENKQIAVCSVSSPSDSKGRYLGGADGEGSIGGDIFFHTEKWGPQAAQSALLFLLGVFFLRQIFVSRSDEKIGDKAH